MSHHLCHPRQACAAFHVSEGEITAGSDGNHLQGIRDRLVRVKGHMGVGGGPGSALPWAISQAPPPCTSHSSELIFMVSVVVCWFLSEQWTERENSSGMESHAFCQELEGSGSNGID